MEIEGIKMRQVVKKSFLFLYCVQPIFGAIFLVFLFLKLLGKIDWSWWWITAPLLVSFILVVIMIIVGVTLLKD